MQKNTLQLPAANTSSSYIRSYLTPDVYMAFAVIGIILVMIFPLHHYLLDFLLATSIAIGLVILLVSLYIKRPLEFAVFPTVLLISTLFRLSLNVATSRNILMSAGNEQSQVSVLITAFGNIVVGGNFIIGLVIFIILMVINFIVITKGAGRVAEVSARFTLDAMPGKQMAIDAELNAGHISADEARKRRKNVEKEADFYGAMDGASKFVRGDAIAAIIIVFVNIVVGLIVGVAQRNMNFLQATKMFSLLAVGDGLIASIPALMISTAAGIIVTRSTSEGNLGDEVTTQFRVHPKALYISSGLVFVLAVIPGFPTLPFLILGGALGFLGKLSNDKLLKDKENEQKQQSSAERQKEDQSQDSMDALMKVDILAVEVGLGVVPLIDPQQDGEIVERIQSIRKQFAQDLGIVVPQIQLRDNLQLEPGQYCIYLKGNKIASGNLMPDYFLAMDPGNVEIPMDGDPTVDPVYGLPALWVSKRSKEESIFRGYTVVNCATVVATHITKIIKENAADLINRQDVQFVVDKFKETNPKVVDEVINSERLTIGDVVKVMQNLLREEVSIRDILSLFECLADHCKVVKNTDLLAEYCRKSLSRSICQKYLNSEDKLLVVTFDKTIEDVLLAGLSNADNGYSYLNLDVKVIQEIMQKLMKGLQIFEKEGTQPILLLSSKLRLSFYRLVVRYVPQIVVLSYDEIPVQIQIKNLSMLV